MQYAKARLQARKLDTRRKVVLGRALMDLAHRSDQALACVGDVEPGPLFPDRLSLHFQCSRACREVLHIHSRDLQLPGLVAMLRKASYGAQADADV